MKRLLSLVFTFLVVLCILPSESFAKSPKVTLSASQTNVRPGDTVTFTVKVEGCETKSLGIIPEYDKDIFELVSGEWLIGGAILSDFSAGCAVIAYTAFRSFEGDIFTFTLKVPENAIITDSTVKCRVQAEDYSLVQPEVLVKAAADGATDNEKDDVTGDDRDGRTDETDGTKQDILPENNKPVFIICGAVLILLIAAFIIIKRCRNR